MIFKDHAKKILKSKGFRFTRQREQTLNILATNNTPISAYQLAERVGIDPATAYRILEVYLDLKLVHKVSGGVMACREFHCQNNNHCHHQFICDHCRMVTEIHIEDSTFIKELGKKYPKFNIKSHQFEFSGLCENCTPNTNSCVNS